MLIQLLRVLLYLFSHLKDFIVCANKKIVYYKKLFLSAINMFGKGYICDAMFKLSDTFIF